MAVVGRSCGVKVDHSSPPYAETQQIEMPLYWSGLENNSSTPFCQNVQLVISQREFIISGGQIGEQGDFVGECRLLIELFGA